MCLLCTFCTTYYFVICNWKFYHSNVITIYLIRRNKLITSTKNWFSYLYLLPWSYKVNLTIWIGSSAIRYKHNFLRNLPFSTRTTPLSSSTSKIYNANTSNWLNMFIFIKNVLCATCSIWICKYIIHISSTGTFFFFYTLSVKTLITWICSKECLRSTWYFCIVRNCGEQWTCTYNCNEWSKENTKVHMWKNGENVKKMWKTSPAFYNSHIFCQKKTLWKRTKCIQYLYISFIINFSIC